MRILDVDYTRVPLERAPLVLVLCQLRFSKRPELEQRTVIEAIRVHLGDEYPDIEPQDIQQAHFQFGPPGFELHQRSGKSHTLRSPHHDWRIVISSAVANLIAPTYSDRTDFLDRVTALRRAVADAGGVPAVERVGVRYVSRVTDEDFLDHLDHYVIPEVLGASDLPTAEGTELIQSMFDMAVQRDSTTGRVRAGLVPGGVTPDPAVEPADGPAWLIDVDMWDASYRPTDDTVDERAAELAASQYQLFRWLVTEEFLTYFGGQV